MSDSEAISFLQIDLTAVENQDYAGLLAVGWKPSDTPESNLLNSTAEPASEDTEDEPSNP